MNKKRLLKVAQALRESPAPKRFYQGKFAHSCGTPACAFGHYAARRDLQKTFKLNVNDVGTDWVTKDGRPVWYDEESVTSHFGITEDQGRELFSSQGCGNAQTPKQAARYIERFVEKNK